MKRIILGLLLFSSFFMQAYSTDDLEQAVQDSDLGLVQVILSDLQLSEQDKTRLVYLAHDVLCFRRNKCDIHSISPDIGMPEAPIVLLGAICFMGGGLMAVSDHQMKNLGGTLCVGGWVMVAVGAIYGYKERCKKLNDLYCNALKIKQLMLKV